MLSVVLAQAWDEKSSTFEERCADWNTRGE